MASVVDYIQRHNISRLVVPTSAFRASFFQQSLMRALQQHCTTLDVIAVNADLSKQAALARRLKAQPSITSSSTLASPQASTTPAKAGFTQWHAAYWNEDKQGYFWAVFGCTLVTSLLAGLTYWFDLANVVMLYL